MEYYIHLGILFCITLILSQGFNLQFGIGRLFNFAHVACYALGAYGVALASTTLGWGTGWSILLGCCLSCALSLIIGFISVRLESDYFAIATLAFSALVSAFLINWRSLTNGVLGIPGIPRPEIFQIDFYNNLNFLSLMIIVTLLVMLISMPFFYGRFARSLRAQAENEAAALSLGKNSAAVSQVALSTGALYAGLAGGFYAYYINYIDPSSFALHEMVMVFTIVILSRQGSFWGIILGTLFILLVPELLRFYELPSSVLGPLRQAMYGLLLLAFLFIQRKTLFPQIRSY